MPKIALIQLSADARPSVNKEKTEAAIREAAAHGAQIICTQELFTTEYFCRTEECDQSIPKDSFPADEAGR